MLIKVAHIGLIVKDIDKAIEFYRDTLGLKFVSRMVMDGENTNKLFNMDDAACFVAYLTGKDNISSPPIELIQFKNHDTIKRGTSFKETCIAEVCFEVKNLMDVYNRLKNKGVEFLSIPQEFLLGNSHSIAVYFKDIDGNILELIEEL